MEKHRTLGTSFSGTERLIFELRRGFEILSSGFGDEQLSLLFRDDGQKSLQRIYAENEIPSIFDSRWQHVTHWFDLQRGDAGKVLGVKGARARQLRESTGVVGLHIEDLDEIRPNGVCAQLRIRGDQGSVKKCIAQVKELLQPTAWDWEKSSDVSYKNGWSGYGRGKWHGKWQGHKSGASWQ